PLSWVRSLGFDALLLSRSLDAEILRAAALHDLRLIAPPPTAPDPSLAPLLHPIIHWYHGTSLDRSQLEYVEQRSDVLRQWPRAWQRPTMAAPAESVQRYAEFLNALVYDIPTPHRGLWPDEEIELLHQQSDLAANRDLVFGVPTMPTERFVAQNISIAKRIGSPPPNQHGWHSLWIQTMRAVSLSPRAILFRSTAPLHSGDAADHQRAEALAYVNGFLSLIGPLVVGGRELPVRIASAKGDANPASIPYSIQGVRRGRHQLLIAAAAQHSGAMPTAGNGKELTIPLTDASNATFAWRITQFVAQRLEIDRRSGVPTVSVLSPDFVEFIVLSDDVSLGGKIAGAAATIAPRAAHARWTLVDQSLRDVRDDWRLIDAARLVPRGSVPVHRLSMAANTLSDAAPVYLGGNVSDALTMARRSDAWVQSLRRQLHEQLLPNDADVISFPPLQTPGGINLSAAWYPLLHATRVRGSGGQIFDSDKHWQVSRLPIRHVTPPDAAQASPTGSNLHGHEEHWVFQRRLEDYAVSDIEIVHGISAPRFASGTEVSASPEDRGFRAGTSTQSPRVLRASVRSKTGYRLPGGYAGTALRLSSPAMRFSADTPLRIELQIKTVGFHGPHQGVLIYDSVGGQELGVRVRGDGIWQTVRLYRQTLQNADVSVMFEFMGDGEAMIDDVKITHWKTPRRTAKSSDAVTR
ncbi:MAG: hypothetical protein AAFP90_07735, partial [Planctomycetota bacterium]